MIDRSGITSYGLLEDDVLSIPVTGGGSGTIFLTCTMLDRSVGVSGIGVVSSSICNLLPSPSSFSFVGGVTASPFTGRGVIISVSLVFP